MNLLHNVKITKIQDHTTAASTDVESDIVDMAGYEGVVFVTSFGTAAAGNLCKVKGNTVGTTVGITDLAGTATAPGASDEDVAIDVFRPQYRYLSFTAIRDVSSTVESMWAIQYGAKHPPVTNTVSGTLLSKSVFEPAAGTA